MKKYPDMTDQEVQNWVAKEYPKRYSGTGFLYHARIVTDMMNEVKFKDKILDVGCGIGFVSQLHPNFDILGIDISDEMLKRNPHKWERMNAEELNYPDCHFDFVVCRSLLHHLEHPKRALQEAYRVLKPDGKWVSWDPNYSILVNTFRKLFQKTDRFSHLHKSFQANELVEMLKVAGFQVDEVKFIGFLAYPLLGFPDIKNFKIPIWLGLKLIELDDWLSKTPLARFAWSLRIKAHK